MTIGGVHTPDDLGPRRFWLIGGYGAVALLVCALWALYAGRDERAMRRLDALARRELYDRTMANVATCAQQPSVQGSVFCEEQARFARLFPECDVRCRDLTDPWVAARR